MNEIKKIDYLSLFFDELIKNNAAPRQLIIVSREVFLSLKKLSDVWRKQLEGNGEGNTSAHGNFEPFDGNKNNLFTLMMFGFEITFEYVE